MPTETYPTTLLRGMFPSSPFLALWHWIYHLIISKTSPQRLPSLRTYRFCPSKTTLDFKATYLQHFAQTHSCPTVVSKAQDFRLDQTSHVVLVSSEPHSNRSRSLFSIFQACTILSFTISGHGSFMIYFYSIYYRSSSSRFTR